LHLSLNNNISYSFETPISYHVIVKNINKISASNFITIDTKNTLNTKNLTLSTCNSAIINAELNTEELTVNSSNSSSVSVSGTAHHQDVTLENSSNYNAQSLNSNTAQVKASNSSRANINAKSFIRYALSNSSVLTYTGNPKINGSKKNSSKTTHKN